MNDFKLPKNFGTSPKRKEDRRLLRGKGRYVDDINFPGQTYAYFLRSSHAHAKILSIDVNAALAAPGVVAVYTGQDVIEDGLGPLICGWMVYSKDGSPVKVGHRSALATDRARFVGDPVAVIIAESRNQAKDAAELVEVDYEPLDAVVNMTKAQAAGSPQLHDIAPNNTAFAWQIGDKAKVDEAFNKATHRVHLELVNNRLIPNAMEPRAALAHYEPVTEQLTLYMTSQNPHGVRLLMSAVMGLSPEHKLRVVSPDVGGGFGSKAAQYPEDIVCLWAAKKLCRPQTEASYLVERIINRAARELKVDPAELRRKNFISKFPHQTPLLMNYDVGDYCASLDKAMEMIDYKGFDARRADAKSRGMLRGIGFSSYVEACGIGPSKKLADMGGGSGFWDSAEVRVTPTAKVEVFAGSHSHGQGHETTYAQVISGMLGVPMENVIVVEGDTDRMQAGTGTYGSRASIPITAIVTSCERIITKAKKIAAYALGEPGGEVDFEDGVFLLRGTNKSLTLPEVAWTAYAASAFPTSEIEPGLKESFFCDPPNFTFPAGCHICEVEIDPDTGTPKIVDFVAVDDFGTVINPMIVEGQIHGGITQGIGQAMLEQAVYDPDSGQLLTGSYMDYTMPRADDLPSYRIGMTVTKSTSNPIGMKGCGEAGSIAAPAAVINAICDALGTEEIEMPATPEKIWRIAQMSRA
jgi:CO/xanthine dehydrogenase Mo-binding subunit